MGTNDALDVDLVARQELAKLGYTQEMSRTRGFFHTVFMSLAILAVPYGLVAPIITALAGGGPVVMLWGWILVSLLTQTMALSVAEICSKYPTSAGAHYWCYRLAPPRYKRVFSWITGWLNLVGNWSAALSVAFGIAQLIVASVGIYHPDWVPTAWQIYLIFLGITAISCGFCLLSNKYLPSIHIACACWTALGIIVNLICISSKAAAGRRPASFALGGFEPASGWTPVLSFLVGLLPPAYTYAGIGLITSMAEEVHNPSEILPKAISLSAPIGTISGIVFLLPILFTLPDVKLLLQVRSGQPIGVMFTYIMGSRAGGFGLLFIIIGIGMFCAISISCAASRATWAFARDKAIPLHAHLCQLSPHSHVPVNALFLSTTIQMLLGLIHLGSSTAYNAFVGVAIMCLGASYALPIALSLVDRRREVAGAPFRLGRAGAIVNVIAVLWVVFAIVLFSLPPIVPVTPSSINHTSEIFVGFVVIGVVWYSVYGRFRYTGPPVPSTESDPSTPSTFTIK